MSMIDISEWFPVEVIYPLLGGAAIWFGVNYAILGPDVIGPRLSERYYLPACVKQVDAAREGYAEAITQRVQSFEEELKARASNAQSMAQEQMNGMFGTDEYGQALKSLMSGFGAVDLDGQVGAAINMELAKERTSFNAALQDEIEQEREGQKFSGADEFCGCNVAEAFSNRIDLAAYTASFRIYKPRMIDQLEGGAFFEPCGQPPVITQ